MNRHITYQIESKDNGLRIDDFLRKNGFSHPILVHLKRTPEGILLNNTWVRTSDLVRTGDTLDLKIEEDLSSDNLVPMNLTFDIIYEDEDILVINKPAHMPIHPSLNNYDNTLANGIKYYYRNETSPFIMRCMNRLDRDTTGITLIAKNPLSAAILSREMKNRKIKRTYYAIVTGHLDPEGVIDAPIGRKSDSLIERQVDYVNGQSAITHYKTIQETEHYSLVSIYLETGRTHQIRVHFKHIGHPLPGDFIYNPDFSDINRQALHAKQLEFTHPITKEPLIFTAPIPNDMLALMNQ